MSAGEFFAEQRKLIDPRKAHLARVGIGVLDAERKNADGMAFVRIAPPGTAPLRDVMPSQADVLAMPTTTERPLLDATHAPMAPVKPTEEFAPAKLPKLLGVNVRPDEE